MIEFVVCDDNLETVKKVSNIITKVMMKNNYEYKIMKYYDYDNNFLNLISNSTRIYILDIETPSRSGIDIARMIRKKSLESIIIFITVHEELGPLLLREEIHFLSFINKFDNCEKRLENSINKALELLKTKQFISIENKSIIYNILISDILYIVKDKITRNSIIVTPNRKYYTKKCLQELKNILDDRFLYSHRSCIVNTYRIHTIDKKNSIIIFDNEEEISLLSKSYKKGLYKYDVEYNI